MTTLKTSSSFLRLYSLPSHCKSISSSSLNLISCLCSGLIYSKPYRLRNLTLRSNLEFQKDAPLEMADKWRNTALLVIDMQRDFIEDGGPMVVKGGKAVVPNVIKAVEVARQRGILIVWVVREHDPLGRDVELFRRHLYGAGVVGPTAKGSAGAELVDGLVIREGDYKLVKMRFSAFFATHLHSFLQGAGINSLVITGVQTPNCIRQTVYDAVALDYQPVTVILDATAAATPDIHLANIYDMKNIGVVTPTLQEWSNV
ncbi:probable inactive nicotinamidase At3g16190 isoform X2 [Prosopis cineraria]|uniref:probable inactive nicotinamidase At3g16190 isoform X2 n=1 Tax=Prosopis cineraria TaxID=364024 RepID=UPI0024106021|nr:probable inactive nicotinamidase At3g16190 isoform X2 [Prosopis cineraria]